MGRGRRGSTCRRKTNLAKRRPSSSPAAFALCFLQTTSSFSRHRRSLSSVIESPNYAGVRSLTTEDEIDTVDFDDLENDVHTEKETIRAEGDTVLKSHSTWPAWTKPNIFKFLGSRPLHPKIRPSWGENASFCFAPLTRPQPVTFDFTDLLRSLQTPVFKTFPVEESGRRRRLVVKWL